MLSRISYKIVIVLVILLGTFTLFLSERYLKNQFTYTSSDITKNIVLSIQNLEDEMNKNLMASALLVQEKLINNSIKTEKDLVLIKNQLGVTAISVLSGKDGKFIMTSNEVFDKQNPFYKDLSLIDPNQCATQKCGEKLCRTDHEILNCKIKRFEVLDAIKNPGVPYILPMFRVTLHSAKPIKAPAKWVVLYNKSLNKIIDIFYTKEQITNILEDYINIHLNSINYINIVDDRGNLIAEAGNKSENKYRLVASPFTTHWKFDVEGYRIDYSYILNIEFSTKELSRQVWVIRILLTTIIVLTLVLIWLFRLILNTKEGDFNRVKNLLIKQKTNY